MNRRQVMTSLGVGALFAGRIELASAAAAPPAAPGPTTRAAAIAGIDAWLTAKVARGLHGSVRLEEGGETILDKGYGLARPGVPITPSTGFDIGSLVKPFTAAAILNLETRGKLRTADAASRFLPSLQGDKAAITIDHLLSHRSGLPDIIDNRGRPIRYTTAFDYEPVDRDEILRRASLCALESPPGAKEHYSNLGYSLLAAIIEAASGQPYEAFVGAALFQPAGMVRTGYVAPGWTKAQLAVGLSRGRPWGSPLDHPWLSDGPSWNLRGNGGMISTTGDLAKWVAALKGGVVLDETARDKLYQLLVHINRRGTRTMGPAGSNTVFDAAYLWYLDENRLLIVMTSDDRILAEDLIPELAGRLLALPTG